MKAAVSRPGQKNQDTRVVCNPLCTQQKMGEKDELTPLLYTTSCHSTSMHERLVSSESIIIIELIKIGWMQSRIHHRKSWDFIQGHFETRTLDQAFGIVKWETCFWDVPTGIPKQNPVGQFESFLVDADGSISSLLTGGNPQLKTT